MKKTYFNILLLLATFLFAAMTSSKPVAQMGWYRNTSGVGFQGTIAIPAGNSPICSVYATAHQCVIEIDDVFYLVYNSKADAENNVTAGLLKYN